MNNLLVAYLALLTELKIGHVEDDEDILNIMDQIWYKLKPEDKDWLNTQEEQLL